MPDTRERYHDLDPAAGAALAALVTRTRQAALATVNSGDPYAAMTAYAVAPGPGFLVHLSDLSPHKAHLRAHSACALLIMEPDDGAGEVLQRPRLSIGCEAEIMPKDSAEYRTGKVTYLEKFPLHERMFSLADFDLVRLTPESGVYIAGFGQAYRVNASILGAIL